MTSWLLGRIPALLVLSLVVPAPVSAQQVVVGLITDELFDIPLEGVLVSLELRDEEGESVVVVTDAEGRFAALLPGPGSYDLRTFLRRYEPIRYSLDVSDSDQPVEVFVEMKPQPLELDGIFVEAKAEIERRRLDLVGFTRRSRGGAGRYIGPEDLENRRFSMRQVFRGIPGLRVTADEDVLMDAAGFGGSCRPTVFVDGVRLAPGFSIRIAVPMRDLDAVEVYNRPAFVPAQYRTLSDTGCGTILFWTR